jgi:steroid 5-alpha reductase family enzyme
VVWWSISVFSHNSWKSPWNFMPWLMKTLDGAPNLLSTLSKNVYATPSLMQFSNNTNSNHLE